MLKSRLLMNLTHRDERSRETLDQDTEHCSRLLSMNSPVVFYNHVRAVVDLCYSSTPNDIFLLSASQDLLAALRNGETGEFLRHFHGHTRPLLNCDLSSNAQLAATASEDFTVKIWNAETGECTQTLNDHNVVQSCKFSKDNSSLLTGGFNQFMRLYDLNHPHLPRDLVKVDGFIENVAWLDPSKILFSLNNKPDLRLFDLNDPTRFHNFTTQSSITSIEVSQDGGLITTCDGYTVSNWDPSTMLRKELVVPYIVESASKHPEKNVVIATGGDQLIHLLDMKNGYEIGNHQCFGSPILCVRFSPGGESFASGHRDSTTRIWRFDEVEMDSDA